MKDSGKTRDGQSSLPTVKPGKRALPTLNRNICFGLTHETDSKANQLFALAPHGESFRKELDAIAPLKASKPVDVPVSNTCQRVLARAVGEADQLGSRLIGTEHLLLGSPREEKSRAPALLAGAGIDLHTARNRVRQYAGLPILAANQKANSSPCRLRRKN